MILLIGKGMVSPRHILAWKALNMPVYAIDSKEDWVAHIHKPEVTLIDIATPNYLHTTMIKEAVKAGKDVICEKPMATTIEDAQDIVQLSKTCKTKIGIVYQFRFNPKMIKLRHDVMNGKYGEIKLVVANYFRCKDQSYYNKAWRAHKMTAGGGTLFNITIHYLDLMQWIFGYPTSISGHKTTSYKHIDVEDTVTASMQFPNGAIGSYVATSIAKPQKHFEFIIYGTQGGTTIQLRQNEYHKENFKAFLNGTNYVKPIEAIKSLQMSFDILK